jgi:hypothetical protein
MTLCLSAICERGNAIACVFDDQWTSTYTAAEGLSKAARINERWLLLYAGDDIRRIGAIYDRVKRELLAASAVTLTQAQETVRKACDDVVNEELAHGPLRPLGVTVAEFLQQSHYLVPNEQWRNRIWDQINAARVGSDFLLVGFDERGQPHLAVLADDGQNHHLERRGRPGKRKGTRELVLAPLP